MESSTKRFEGADCDPEKLKSSLSTRSQLKRMPGRAPLKIWKKVKIEDQEGGSILVRKRIGQEKLVVIQAFRWESRVIQVNGEDNATGRWGHSALRLVEIEGRRALFRRGVFVHVANHGDEH